MKDSFSKRHGFASPEETEIRVREDARDEMRAFFVQLCYECGFALSTLPGVVCQVLKRRPDRNNWTERYVLGNDPVEVTAFTQTGILSQNGLADSVMGVMRFKSGLIAQFHDSFTAKHAETGLEIIGTEGTLIASNVMTQQPVGEVSLVNAQGTRKLILEHVNLYEAGFRQFAEAVAGRTQLATTGLDGIWSLATGAAVVEAAKTGQAIPVVLR